MSDDARDSDLVIAATSNPGKLREIQAILGESGIRVRALDESGSPVLPAEGACYQANATRKALAVARATGRAAVADDSGLEVDALDGQPGPFSARFGGPGLDDAGRVQHLLDALRRIPAASRRARFVCVAAWATPRGAVRTARGECTGRILGGPRGGAGFGYDPIFQADGEIHSMAELPAQRKNQLSHRARAFRALAAAIAADGG